MKSKLTMLTLVGTLALSAIAPNGMALGKQKGFAARTPNAVAAKSATAKAASKLPGKKYPTAIPSKDTGRCTIALDRAVC
ncbi:MAG TPA: hypothetical protein VMD98_09765 [Bryocella sp.]|nr:hypothetical protein [Bryocella sp.]